MSTSREQSTADLHLILEHAPVGVVFLQNRVVTHCNRRFETLFGYARGELDGQSSRRWYLTDADWLAAATRCYEPLARGESFCGEMLLARQNGEPLWCEVKARAVDPDDLARGSIWTVIDITVRKQAEEALARAHTALEQQVTLRTQELRETIHSLNREIDERQRAQRQLDHLAWHDPVTGLPNHALLERQLDATLAEARQTHHRCAVVCMDLDRFKSFAQTLGHDEGHEVLKAVAHRLRAAVGESDTVACLGGNEFGLLLTHVDDAAGMAQRLERVREAVLRPVPVGEGVRRLDCGIGVSVHPEDGDSAPVLLKNANLAMRRTKGKERAGLQFFNDYIDRDLQARLKLEQALQVALERGHIDLHYQPLLDIATNRVVGLEALARWRTDEQGWVPPDQFIPLAEELGLIGQLGTGALEMACRQARAWQREGLPLLRMAVNVSPTQLTHTDFVEQVLETLKRTDLAPQWLELEITESVMMGDIHKATGVLERLHQAGIHISVDDFGTGYSSLSYLTRLKLGKLKIDRSFVTHLASNPGDAVICRTIVAMAHNLGLKVTAEGVETEHQRELLAQFGCDEYQGYLFSRPLAGPELATLLRAQPA